MVLDLEIIKVLVVCFSIKTLFILSDSFVAHRHHLLCSLFPTFPKTAFICNFAESFMCLVNNKLYFKLILKRTQVY